MHLYISAQAQRVAFDTRSIAARRGNSILDLVMMAKEALITGLEVGSCLETTGRDLLAFSISKERAVPTRNGCTSRFKGLCQSKGK